MECSIELQRCHERFLIAVLLDQPVQARLLKLIFTLVYQVTACT